jgi:hypothetical protein
MAKGGVKDGLRMFMCWWSVCGRVGVGHWRGKKLGRPDRGVKTRDVKTPTGMCRARFGCRTWPGRGRSERVVTPGGRERVVEEILPCWPLKTEAAVCVIARRKWADRELARLCQAAAVSELRAVHHQQTRLPVVCGICSCCGKSSQRPTSEMDDLGIKLTRSCRRLATG